MEKVLAFGAGPDLSLPRSFLPVFPSCSRNIPVHLNTHCHVGLLPLFVEMVGIQ